jgi:hypothetical protein
VRRKGVEKEEGRARKGWHVTPFALGHIFLTGKQGSDFLAIATTTRFQMQYRDRDQLLSVYHFLNHPSHHSIPSRVWSPGYFLPWSVLLLQIVCILSLLIWLA